MSGPGLFVGAAAAIISGTAAAVHAACYKRDNRAAALWVALVCFLPFLGAGLYLAGGVNRIRRRAAHLRHKAVRRQGAPPASGPKPAATEPELPASLDHLAPLARAIGELVRQPLLAGNALAPLVNGDAAYPAMLAEIASATRSIALSTYLFGADEAGLAFIAALGAAVRRGVRVRVLIDASNTFFAGAGVYRALHRAGVPYARFLPTFSHWAPLTWNLRNHRKLLIVDGRRGFTGGMNIVSEHVLRRRPAHPAADIQFRVEGPVVAHLQDAFVDDWAFTTGEQLDGEDWFPTLSNAGAMLARGIASGPDQPLETLRWTVLSAIAAARDSVRIVTPYFLPDPPLISALNVARRRGVAVEIVLPQSSDVPFVQWASAAQWWQLLEHGCRIWINPPPFDHAKFVIVDDAWALVGSANWDPRSFRLNFEFEVECYDRAFAGGLRNMYEQRRSLGREVTLAEMDRRPFAVRLRDGIARLAAPYL